MIKIPRFSLNEYTDISLILKEAGIPFQTQTETLSIGMTGGYHEYHILVSEEDTPQTIRILMEHFGLIKGLQEPFSGECPACGALVENQSECPDCGLSFWPKPHGLDDEHPFVLYLSTYGLL